MTQNSPPQSYSPKSSAYFIFCHVTNSVVYFSKITIITFYEAFTCSDFVYVFLRKAVPLRHFALVCEIHTIQTEELHKFIKLGSDAKQRYSFHSNKHIWHTILSGNSHFPHSKTWTHSPTIVRNFRTYGTLARDYYVTDLKGPRNFRRLWVSGHI